MSHFTAVVFKKDKSSYLVTLEDKNIVEKVSEKNINLDYEKDSNKKGYWIAKANVISPEKQQAYGKLAKVLKSLVVNLSSEVVLRKLKKEKIT